MHPIELHILRSRQIEINSIESIS